MKLPAQILKPILAAIVISILALNIYNIYQNTIKKTVASTTVTHNINL